MNKVINQYLIFGFLKTIINVILIFICLGVILNLFEEIEFFKDLDIGIQMPIFLTFMYIPNMIIKLLPFIVFFGSMWYFFSIKSNTDLLSLKTFGFSNFKIIFILTVTVFIFGLVIIFAVNPITSLMIKYYEVTKAEYSRDTDHLVSINKNGVWIKEVDTDSKNLRIITAKELNGNFLSDVTVYLLDKDNNMISRVDTELVDISEKKWVFNEVNEVVFGNEINKSVLKEDYSIESDYDIEKINTQFKNLDTISFINLIIGYKNLQNKGYQKELLDEKINTFLALPIFLVLMVVLAAIFTINTNDKKQNLYYIFISIISCVVIYYFKDLSIALGQTNRISLITAVWVPIVALTLFCSIGVIQVNEK
jgi:lipopolysaccharide export system permease protein|tara:strand:+ start:1777 stop:2871 length:1095 start_codon:yes stop_codon:yes gene_type:complete